ncbi:MAG: hypothetical protein Q4F41_11405 [Eubacteriales bacterium]|nr:hypothetical protein [Eubacteriales bacterium]
MKKIGSVAMAVLLFFGLSACGSSEEQTAATNVQIKTDIAAVNGGNLSGVVPDELEYIPDGYETPSEHPGTLEKLTYQTWESFSYEEHTGIDKRSVGVSAVWLFGGRKVSCFLSEPWRVEQRDKSYGNRRESPFL